MTESLADIFRRLRGARSVADVEETCGINRGTMSRLERGEETPSLPRLRRLIDDLGGTTDDHDAAERAWIERQRHPKATAEAAAHDDPNGDDPVGAA